MRLLPHGAWDRRGTPEGPQEVEDRSEGVQGHPTEIIEFSATARCLGPIGLADFPP